ncbi:MAG: hypothetical protein H6611_09695 [Ignavibacteriales bacterium]|nr:hypothetical protein [Ignavibacteriales bacterium]
MKTGKCPKCNSREIFKHCSRLRSNYLPVAIFNHARLEDYVCTKCGYKETYVVNDNDLKKIKEKWKRVGN